MVKKRGFTLVECLVSLTLLSIITVSTHSLISTCNITIQKSSKKTDYLIESSNVVECFKNVNNLEGLYKFILDNSGSATTSITLLGKGVLKLDNIGSVGSTKEVIYEDASSGKCLAVYPITGEDLNISPSFKPKSTKTFLLKVYVAEDTILTSCITI